MQLSPFSCHLVPLRSKYSPQHPILKHPQPAFLHPAAILMLNVLTCKYGESDNIPQNLGRSAYLPKYTASNPVENNLDTVTRQD